jgi:hypothetical protein
LSRARQRFNNRRLEVEEVPLSHEHTQEQGQGQGQGQGQTARTKASPAKPAPFKVKETAPPPSLFSLASVSPWRRQHAPRVVAATQALAQVTVAVAVAVAVTRHHPSSPVITRNP